jgi:protein phosphatase
VTTIPLPSGALVLLVGVAGSGKTTFAARHFPPEQVLASDEFRARLSGDAADQSVTAEAFRLLRVALGGRLARGLLTVVDATNTQPWARGQLLATARRAGRASVAIVLDLPLEVCQERNAHRSGRRVPPGVVRRQHRELGRGLPALAREGHALVAILRDAAEVDAARVLPEPDQSSVEEQSATSRT